MVNLTGNNQSREYIESNQCGLAPIDVIVGKTRDRILITNNLPTRRVVGAALAATEGLQVAAKAAPAKAG